MLRDNFVPQHSTTITEQKMSALLTLSIVSHGQAYLVRSLLGDLSRLPQQNFEVVITINIPEDESPYQVTPFPLRIIRNVSPKGFGGNHNAAFSQTSSRWFAVVNPDIRIDSLDLQVLLSPFNNESVATVAPTVISGDGKLEDSARYFPTLFRFAKRFFFRQRSSDYEVQPVPYPVDWVAGMFVVFRREAFKEIGGFDDRRFYMYLEDADICRRLAKKGWQVLVNPNVQVIHLAQRASRRNLKHMRWHAVSALRFLTGL
jgi:N-acetylglucosaminyl-diphospho-decaprenol L-rhamnosyltransferase